MAAVRDPGSFRDPLSHVVLDGDSVYRLYSDAGERDRKEVWPFVESVIADGLVIAADAVDVPDRPEIAGAIRHPRLPLISYPFEWSFSMLRDAALLQLELTGRGLDAGVGVKDATSYNIQFTGNGPLFIDVGSFEPRSDGDPWYGYQQFCQLFLYPLMVQAYAGVPFQPLLRGSINGITVEQARGILGPLRPKLQRGRFTHVLLHALAQRKLADSSGGIVEDVKAAGMKPEVLKATVNRLAKLVGGLDLGLDESTWSEYSDRGHYPDEGLRQKAEFVDRALASTGPHRQVWDVGCNDGLFSRVAADHAELVVAMDADALVIDRLYAGLGQDSSDAARRIVPLVVDLSTAGGGLGWRGAERPGFFDRTAPDAVIYLAVVHHLALTFNIPLAQQLDLLADISPNLVIEFPSERDPMVHRLVRNKRAGLFEDYSRTCFEGLLHERFAVEEQVELTGGTRTIYRARRR